MISAPVAANEAERLRKLSELDILDTLEEACYDELTALAAHICGVPIALVSLVDRDRQWFKSHHGLNATQTDRELAFCAHAILGDGMFVVEDADADQRFFDNPLVTGEPHVKFYAGVPLAIDSGVNIGTLCVIDRRPRTLTSQQLTALRAIANQVTRLFELRLKVKQLSEADKAKDEFIALVSHELRTPLTAINGALGLLEAGVDGRSLSQPAQQMVKIAHRNSDRLLHIVNDILDRAKIEAGKFELRRAKLDVADVVDRAAELNRLYCEKCGCDLEVRKSINDHLWVDGDADRLIQVLTNLISNAAKASPSGDRVEVHLDRDGDRARVSVVDHGPGIPADKISSLFTKFSQGQATGFQKMPGTGLGLSISKHIIDLHGGQIGIESVPGVRTEFSFSLPTLKRG